MGWAIGSSKMLKKTARHLAIINALVFFLVLSVCSAINYALFMNSMNRDAREDLEHLMTVLESSLEAPEEEHDDSDVVPDVVQSEGRISVGGTPHGVIQWFSPEGQLLAQKGSFNIKLPLNKGAKFQEQQNEHALVLTRLVRHKGNTLGYFRIAMPLSDSDRSKKNLLVDLIFGTLFAALVCSAAILWLVRQGLKPVAASMQQLSDFSADASHELHGPVMAIKTNGTVALKYSEGMRESDREKIGAIVNAANQMSTTIDGLLRLADLEQPLPAKELRRISVYDLVADLCKELEPAITSKTISINTVIARPDLSFTGIETDAKTALLNVLRNAIVYSHDGGAVNIKASKVGKFVEFQIEDFGIGIEPNDLPRIFDRFWRSDEARSYRSGGRGLGLAITKNIVERYRGSIAVESKPGTGTRVSLRFPEVQH